MPTFDTLPSGLQILGTTPSGDAGLVLQANFTLLDGILEGTTNFDATIQGTTNDNSAAVLTLLNSDGTNLLQARNDGHVYFGAPNNYGYWIGASSDDTQLFIWCDDEGNGLTFSEGGSQGMKLAMNGSDILMNVGGGTGGGTLSMDGGSISNVGSIALGNFAYTDGPAYGIISWNQSGGSNPVAEIYTREVGTAVEIVIGNLYNNGVQTSDLIAFSGNGNVNLLGNNLNLNTGGGSGGGTLNMDSGTIVNCATYNGYVPLSPTGDGSLLTNLTSGNLTGALPAINGNALTGITAAQVGADASGTATTAVAALTQTTINSQSSITPIADGTYTISATLGGSATFVSGICTAWTPAS